LLEIKDQAGILGEMKLTKNKMTYFPFANPRDQQVEAIELARLAFQQDKRFVIIEAGTGVGKSAIGVALNRLINSAGGRQHKSSGDWKDGGYFLTTQKILQEQYVNDFSDMLSLKSSSNYQCRYHKKNTCADSLRALSCADKKSKFFKTCAFNCTYKKTKEEFIRGEEGITNFAYFLAETQYSGKLKPRQMLVIDEAHNIEIQLSKFIEVTISERFAKTILKLQWPGNMTLKQSVYWVKNTYLPRLTEHVKFTKAGIKKYIGMEDRLQEFTSLAKKLEMLDKHECKINRFLEVYDPENWVVNRQEGYGRSMEKIEFKPIDVSTFSEDLLFKHGAKIILMSATILDGDAFCESLGIPKSEASFLSFESPFPPENKPILVNSVGSMSSKSIDSTLPKMVKAIKLIMEEHKSEKGIVHCHSYKVANYIKKNIRSRRLLIHDSTNRDEILAKHIASKGNTILLSPSMTEGVDLKDDCSRFQVLCKVPYPYLGDKLVKKRMYKWKWWYPLQTAKTIVQSVGRSVRHKDDFAVTYILDSDWERFYSRNKHFFPKDFKKSIVGG